ncbi:hypothetical protein E3E35_01555 [Thermococcus sp. GR7]|uniref:hypothetical protein n=1 Tax=unclassified Thermococcus TaxID=2627626 RepID=UPI001431CC8E|nr:MULTISPECIES: hypothetical protein [unclassified Thermococcus]NJE46116.1 hypothetical protein [Thermococcus sp. GR7]NJE78248.1 hypothetical protein [Thermococcus sp. GR4]NJF22313.1 hypothetical protein [Thermococcus sp. GR5]
MIKHKKTLTLLCILGVIISSYALAAPVGTKWSKVNHEDFGSYVIYNSAVLEYSGYFVGYEDDYFYILSSQTDKKVLGAWPHPGIDYYFADVIGDLLEIAASKLFWEAGIVISAAEIAKEMKQGIDEFLNGDKTMDGSLTAEWDLGPVGESKCSHYLKFWVDTETNKLIEFSVKDRVYGAYNSNEFAEVAFDVMIDVFPSSGDPEVISIQSTTDRVLNKIINVYYRIRYHGDITKFYITYNGRRISVYKINPNAIYKYSSKFGLPKSIAEKFKKSGKPVYYYPEPIGINVTIRGDNS